ncbi:transporter substrate-binding domain-containing protein [Pseudomonas sp. LA21]|uniref:substrate-binding periplasmic protein n=1 Tax=unclassified Pseudomonas TaxID=196821 RepID=UPI001A9CCF35|nr:MULTISPECIES: transporter substrate-binding domain-containing protein [unclassified Pseudomonas]MCJ1884601.1 transporter substrate-binding domain-containing protein [Pseudomonas sp. LA21]
MRRLLCLLCMLWWLPALADAPPTEIRVASEAWANYTQADGRGLAWDLLRALYEPEGVRLVPRSEPYVRSVGLVQRGEADAWVGAYRDEISNVIYPRWPFDVDPIGALGLKASPVPKPVDLDRYRLAWMRGYSFDRYLEHVSQRNELQRRSSALPMLDSRRIDYFIDARPELEEMLQGKGVDASAYRITEVASIPLYLGFANNERGRALARLFDARMQVLYRTGELERLFARWDWPYAPLKPLLPPKE